MASPIAEAAIPEVLKDDDADITKRRRALVRQWAAFGMSQKEMAERLWEDMALRPLVPSKSVEALRRVIASDVAALVSEVGLEKTSRTDFARWQYLSRVESLFRKAMKEAMDDENNEWYRTAMMKLAFDTSKAAAKVQGVDVERPLKVKFEEEWEVFIDGFGNAQRKEISEGDDEE